MNRRVAFTLIELLIVMAILGVLVTMLVPVITGQIEEARRKSCQANLHAIGQKMTEYAHDNKGRFPAVYGNVSGGRCIHAGAADPTFFAKGNSCNMWVLVREDRVAEQGFICPSTDHSVDATSDPENEDDFVTHNSLSYSMHNQTGDNDNGPDWFPLTLLSPSGMALMADRNPIAGICPEPWPTWKGGEFCNPDSTALAEHKNNSLNHDQEGQNVVFVDGHVDWCETPKVGINGDNIWTWDDGTEWGSVGSKNGLTYSMTSPSNDTDSLLFP